MELKEIIHYVLLVLFGVFLAHWLSDVFGLEALVVQGKWYGWLVLFIWYLAFIWGGDKILKYFEKKWS